MKYQVTRTYNGNTDVIEFFTTLAAASEMYYKTKKAVGNTARIELEEVK
jgi:hypothetical protein